ncbi:MAG TPA: hypothetical protein VEB23_04500 [Ramlibacter sp.]|nr:hypothetical protein [Ramlibacter sp.]
MTFETQAEKPCPHCQNFVFKGEGSITNKRGTYHMGCYFAAGGWRNEERPAT